mmetsp:Transcript_3938/g.13964  ORF Transcript_3938/g.13964 Transcript_3938/m.13964 type:complete len:210 (+) Transcript_3938:79-708(+)
MPKEIRNVYGKMRHLLKSGAFVEPSWLPVLAQSPPEKFRYAAPQPPKIVPEEDSQYKRFVEKFPDFALRSKYAGSAGPDLAIRALLAKRNHLAEKKGISPSDALALMADKFQKRAERRMKLAGTDVNEDILDPAQMFAMLRTLEEEQIMRKYGLYSSQVVLGDDFQPTAAAGMGRVASEESHEALSPGNSAAAAPESESTGHGLPEEPH